MRGSYGDIQLATPLVSKKESRGGGSYGRAYLYDRVSLYARVELGQQSDGFLCPALSQTRFFQEEVVAQICCVYDFCIENGECADAGQDEILEGRGAECACSDEEDVCALESLLSRRRPQAELPIVSL